MRVAIYQINYDRDPHKVMYMKYAYLEQFQGTKEVDSTIYDKVFEGDIDCESLAEIYEKYHITPPSGSYGREISVSDVLKIGEGKDADFYYCNSQKDFFKIPFAEEKCGVRLAEEKIEVLLIQVGKQPKRVWVKNKLEDMQELVGGEIEEYMPYKDDIALVVNAHGKSNDFPLNRAIYSEETKEIMDIICGDFFIVHAPVDSEKYRSLPENMMEKYAGIFENPERFILTDKGIKARSYHKKLEKGR